MTLGQQERAVNAAEGLWAQPEREGRPMCQPPQNSQG